MKKFVVLCAIFLSTIPVFSQGSSSNSCDRAWVANYTNYKMSLEDGKFTLQAEDILYGFSLGTFSVNFKLSDIESTTFLRKPNSDDVSLENNFGCKITVKASAPEITFDYDMLNTPSSFSTTKISEREIQFFSSDVNEMESIMECIKPSTVVEDMDAEMILGGSVESTELPLGVGLSLIKLEFPMNFQSLLGEKTVMFNKDRYTSKIALEENPKITFKQDTTSHLACEILFYNSSTSNETNARELYNRLVYELDGKFTKNNEVKKNSSDVTYFVPTAADGNSTIRVKVILAKEHMLNGKTYESFVRNAVAIIFYSSQ